MTDPNFVPTTWDQRFQTISTNDWEGPVLHRVLRGYEQAIDPSLATSVPVIPVGQASAVGNDAKDLNTISTGYPAVDINPANWMTDGINPDVMLGSALTGANEGLARIRQLQDAQPAGCEKTKIILLGYSQGAMVARHLAQLAPDDIAGSVLVGDPYTLPNDGTQGDGKGGIGVESLALGMFQTASTAANELTYNTSSFYRSNICHGQDPICNFNLFDAPSLFNGIPDHTNYASTDAEAQQKGSELAQLVSQAATAPVTPASPPPLDIAIAAQPDLVQAGSLNALRDALPQIQDLINQRGGNVHVSLISSCTDDSAYVDQVVQTANINDLGPAIGAFPYRDRLDKVLDGCAAYYTLANRNRYFRSDADMAFIFAPTIGQTSPGDTVAWGNTANASQYNYLASNLSTTPVDFNGASVAAPTWNVYNLNRDWQNPEVTTAQYWVDQFKKVLSKPRAQVSTPPFALAGATVPIAVPTTAGQNTTVDTNGDVSQAVNGGGAVQAGSPGVQNFTAVVTDSSGESSTVTRQVPVFDPNSMHIPLSPQQGAPPADVSLDSGPQFSSGQTITATVNAPAGSIASARLAPDVAGQDPFVDPTIQPVGPDVTVGDGSTSAQMGLTIPAGTTPGQYQLLFALSDGAATAKPITVVAPGVATQLHAIDAVTNPRVGATLHDIRIEAVDASGIRDTTVSGQADVQLTGTPMTCPNPVIFNAGVATLSGCIGTTPGLAHISVGIAGLASENLDVPIIGTATALKFLDPPPTDATTTSSDTVRVAEVDSAGNIVPDNTTIWTLQTGGLSDCDGEPTVDGIAVLRTCPPDSPRAAVQLQAEAPNLPDAFSAPFPVRGPIVRAAITGPGPAAVAVGAPFSFTTEFQDAAGNVVAPAEASLTYQASYSSTATVSCVSIGSDTSGAVTASGCVTNEPSPGAALVVGVQADGEFGIVRASYSMTAVGQPTTAVFTTQPSNGISLAPLTTQPVVTLKDSQGNIAIFTNSQVPLVTNSGPSGGTLQCSPATPTAGVATFTDCTADIAGTYSLQAAVDGVAPAVSTTLTIAPGPVAKLTVVGTATNTKPFMMHVTAYDAAGNLQTTATGNVSVHDTISGNLVSCGSGSLALSGGSAAGSCVITWVGNVSLVARYGSISSAPVALTIAPGPIAQLAFLGYVPDQVRRGIAGSFLIAFEDSFGNPVVQADSSSSNNTLVRFSSSAGGSSYAIGCSVTPVASSPGQAVVSACTLPTTGAGATLSGTVRLTFTVTLGSGRYSVASNWFFLPAS